MTTQPRGPVRVALLAAVVEATTAELNGATARAIKDGLKHAHALEEQRVLSALMQRGPTKFSTLCRVALPSCGDRIVDAAVQRLRKRDEIRLTQDRPPLWQLTPIGIARLAALARTQSPSLPSSSESPQ